MNTEWGFTSASDSAGYGTQLIQYMKDKGISWTGWIFSSSWTPQMLTSLNAAAATEVRNPSGNLMFKAYHDTMSVLTVVNVKQPVAGAVSAQNISITNSTIQFTCAEASPVVLSIYSLSGNCVGTILDQTLTKGSYSVRWNARSGDGTNVAPGLYTVRLKVKDREYHAQLNVLR
jgi:flagellar hook assembly protein FlgD